MYGIPTVWRKISLIRSCCRCAPALSSQTKSRGHRTVQSLAAVRCLRLRCHYGPADLQTFKSSELSLSIAARIGFSLDDRRPCPVCGSSRRSCSATVFRATARTSSHSECGVLPYPSLVLYGHTLWRRLLAIGGRVRRFVRAGGRFADELGSEHAYLGQ
ncbi:hypothetical protein PYCCODRAFT_1256878 [Trametes coccinea BRFM310]|uniref:Uncharacterized protein n=1 Tax=Trametes coccinea (strain BRFM310) TaxID=1353009 RepID=A0A1Y2I6B4_TRAC3|nr:hypothetical protein PYCCODRAFT_1256878 [Trametes coccinea BRFM310]